MLKLICVLQLLEDKAVTEEGAQHILKCVLNGLHMHGQHDGVSASLTTLALVIYEEMVGARQNKLGVKILAPHCLDPQF